MLKTVLNVLQGDVWSMKLYCIYNDDLLRELRNSRHGMRVGNIDCGSPTFADDLSLVSISKDALNRMLDITYQYSRTWRFVFGVEKCVVLIFGKDESPHTQISLGGTPLTVVKSHQHVGVPLCTSTKAESEATQRRVNSCRSVLYTMQSLAPPRAMLSPVVGSKLYWAVCAPKLTYGLEVWGVAQEGFVQMEHFHNTAGKTIQGLPTQTPNPACHATLGWKSIEMYVDIARLMFLWKIMMLPATNLYNRLMIKRLCKLRFGDYLSDPEGPIACLYGTAIKYGLVECVHVMLDSGIVYPRCKWTTQVNAAVLERQASSWVAKCMMYKSLGTFQYLVPKIAMLAWWRVCKVSNSNFVNKCRTVLLLITGTHSLATARGRFAQCSRLCQLCDRYVEETITHFLLECVALTTHRDPLFQLVKDLMPPAMVNALLCMTPEQQMQFLLGELGYTNVSEWYDIHRAVACMCYELYKAREALLNV